MKEKHHRCMYCLHQMFVTMESRYDSCYVHFCWYDALKQHGESNQSVDPCGYDEDDGKDCNLFAIDQEAVDDIDHEDVEE